MKQFREIIRLPYSVYSHDNCEALLDMIENMGFTPVKMYPDDEGEEKYLTLEVKLKGYCHTCECWMADPVEHKKKSEHLVAFYYKIESGGLDILGGES